jgi:hypothetical protein
LHLEWTHVGPDAHHYEVWRANAPYFNPGPEGEKIKAYVYPANGTFYDDADNVLGDPAVNYYYVILTIDADGRPSPPSHRFGEFDFSLTPGT